MWLCQKINKQKSGQRGFPGGSVVRNLPANAGDMGLIPGRKAMTNLDSVLKSRDIALLTKAHLVKAVIYPVVMYGYDSWTIKKAEHRRIDSFELWGWRRHLRITWTARRSKQSILKKSTLNIHWKDWCWSSDTLVTGWEELTHWKRLMLGKVEGR